MSLLDRLIATFAPHTCCGCGSEGALLCLDCLAAMPPAQQRCYRCNRPSAQGRTCPNCFSTTALHSAISVTMYDGVAKNLVGQLKFSGTQAAARLMAHRMALLLKDSLNGADCIIVPVPTATTRVRQRGYDQAKLLARELAWQTRLPYVDCLVRHGQTQQVGASRTNRLRQLQDTFRVRKSRQVKHRTVILVDDVTTTGATLTVAARSLLAAGASSAESITFAQA